MGKGILHRTASLRAFIALVLVVSSGCESALLREVTYRERLGDLPAARAAAERAVAARPSDPEAHYLYGRVLLADGDYAAAHVAFATSQERSARYREQIAYLLESAFREAMTRGVEAYESGLFAEAATYFGAASQIKPESTDAFRALGHAATQAGDRRAAIEAYEAAVALTTDDLELWNNLAELTALEGEYERALEISERVYTMDPAFRPGLRRLAFVEEKLGRFDQAEAHYRLLIDGGHTHADARNLAFLLYNRQKYADALPHLQLLADHAQPDWSVLKILCETYLALEDFPRAIDVGILLLEQRPDDRDVVSNLILAYEKVGDTEHVERYRARLARMEDEL
jgi:tetratricopeptide (TPR) repeat protein